MILFMSEKKIDKVCIDCIDANEHLKISSDFKVPVEYGTCDCCGKRYIVVPFRRFFSENIKITPCTELEDSAESVDNKQPKELKEASWVKPFADVMELQKGQVKQIEELQTQVKEMLEKLSAIELSGGEETEDMKMASVGDIIEPTKTKDKKSKDLDKVYE